MRRKTNVAAPGRSLVDLGRWVVRTLLDAGHEVVGADRERPPDDGGARHRTVNLTDVGQVAGAMAGCDAVVHLGAVPGPDRYPDEVVFGNNTLSTFAVLQAASLLGVSRAVVASEAARRAAFLRNRPEEDAHELWG